jgi:hypothetical protein
MFTEPKTVTRKEFADALRVSPALVTKWQRLGKVRTVKLGRCVRFPVEELSRVAQGGIHYSRFG